MQCPGGIRWKRRGRIELKVEVSHRVILPRNIQHTEGTNGHQNSPPVRRGFFLFYHGLHFTILVHTSIGEH
jgi:hypothetical protein